MSRDINKSFQSEIDKAAFIKQKIEESAGSSTGGSSSGGGAFASSESGIYWSNFYTDVPDAIILPDSAGNQNILNLNQLLTNDEIFYVARYYPDEHKYISFKNDDIGEVGTYRAGVGGAVTSLSGILDEGGALYYGGGSSLGNGITSLDITKDIIPLVGSGVKIPDSILIKDATRSTDFFNLDLASIASGSHFSYETNNGVGKRWYIAFDVNDGSYKYIAAGVDVNVSKEFGSIQEYIANGRATYYGDSSSSNNSSSSNGSSTFAALTDTPTELTADKYLKVNTEGTALELVDAPVGSGGGSGEGANTAEIQANQGLFEGVVPFAISALTDNTAGRKILYLDHYGAGETHDNQFIYSNHLENKSFSVYFKTNTATGEWEGSNNITKEGDGSLASYIANGHAFYFGGGSSSGGGIGNLDYIKTLYETGVSDSGVDDIKLRFTEQIPDAIVAKDGDGGGAHWDLILKLNDIGINAGGLQAWYARDSYYVYFDLNTETGNYVNSSNIDVSEFKTNAGLKDYIDEGRAIYYGGGSSAGGGGGSSTFAALTDTPTELTADKYLKVNTEGTALELVDAPVGSGGGSSGGAGSLQVIKDKSNFYTDLPDAIVWPHTPISIGATSRAESILHLRFIHSEDGSPGLDIWYESRDVGQGGAYLGFTFKNNADGEYNLLYSSQANFQDIPDSDVHSLRWFIENSRAIYYGGGSGGGNIVALPHSEAAPDNYILLEQGILNDLVWEEKAPLSAAKALYDSSAASNGKIYCAGGHTGSATDVVESYDPVVDSWETLTSMSKSRYGASLAALGGKLYSMGGALSDTSVEVYDISTDQWTPGVPLISNFHSATSIAVDGKIYLIGGRSALTSTYSSRIECFDPSTNQWSSLTDMPTGRSESRAVWFEGRIWVIGGVRTTNSAALNTVESYDPITDSWRVESPLVTAKKFAAVWVMNGRIYAAGGGSGQRSVEEYDSLTKQWSDASFLPNSQYGGEAFVIGDYVYVLVSNIDGANSDKLLAANSTEATNGVYNLYINENGGGGSSSSGGGGSSTFAALTDTPTELTADKYLKVNTEGTALELVDAPVGSGGGSGEGANTAEIQAHQGLFEGVVPFAISALTSNTAGRKILYLDHYGAGGASEDYFLYSNHLDAGRFAVYFKTNTVTGEWLTSSTITKEGDGSLASYIANGHAFYFGGGSSDGGSAIQAVSITGGGDGGSSVGYNDRSLTTIQGVNGVAGLTLDNNIVTLTEPGRYHIKARSGSYVSELTSTTIYFISGDYETQRFESQRGWCHAGAYSSDVVVTESSVVVDITQTTTFKIETYISKAKTGNGLSYGGGASVFVQR